MRLYPKNILFGATLAINCLLCFFLIFYERLQIPPYLQVVGRAHPLFLHFPIVLFAIFIVWIWIGPIRHALSQPVFRGTGKWLLLITAFTAAITALMGIFLSKEAGYDEDTLALHKWSGAMVSLLTFLWYIFYDKIDKTKITLGVSSVLSIAMLVIAGHQGASITHGNNFLLAPVIKEKKQQKADFDRAFVFADMVKPILDSKCLGCHNSTKSKGELVMETRQTMEKGGKDGALWDTAHVDLSLLLQRIHLPLEEKKHMPPTGKPQLTDQEITILYNWIKDGANFETKVKDLQPADTLRSIAGKIFSNSNDIGDLDFAAASEKTIEGLNTNYRVVYPLSKESPGIAVDFFGAAFFKPEQLKELLKIKTQLVSLNLNKMPVTDNDLPTISQFINLRRLNLSFTRITGSGLAALEKLAQLKSLSLTNTPVKADDLQKIASLSELRHLYIWNSDLSETQINHLRKKYPDLDIETGSRTDTMFVKLNPPIFQNENPIIDSPVQLLLKHYVPGVTIRYTIDGTDPDSINSTIYNNQPMVANQELVKAKAFKPGWHSSDLVQYQFYKATYKPDTIILFRPPDSLYKGKGSATLKDLVKGSLNFGDGKWIAFRRNDMECMLEFPRPVDAQSVTISSMINLPALIYPPRSITISGGNDKKSLKVLYHFTPTRDTANQTGYLIPYECKFNPIKVRYIKVTVEPYGKLPKKIRMPKNDLGWFFADELFVN
jgi:uncharacterized membrane protein